MYTLNCIYIDAKAHLCKHLMSSVFTNGQGDQGSILGQVIPKTQKMVLDADLLNTQHYKVRIRGKVKQSREWNSAHLGMGCSHDNLPEAMNDWEGWRERVRDIHADGTTR